MIETGTLRVPDCPLGLYIHIPYCVRKCRYCDFCSFPVDGNGVPDAYVSALCAQIRETGKALDRPRADTVFFGGGTPTLLEAGQWLKIMEALKASFAIAPDAEISTECNPATAGLSDFEHLLSLGFNRLSLGIQSLSDNELRLLGRIHSAKEAEETVRDAFHAGFTNVNADLMFGIPGQTPDSFGETIEKTVSLGVSHVSAYALQVEPGTPFYEQAGQYVFPDDDETRDLYDLVTEKLRTFGIERYEISNFARPGFECKHNLKYWRCDPYLGFGPSAHSLIGHIRFETAPDVHRFITGERGFALEEELTKERLCDEALMLGLRLTSGADLDRISSLSGVDARKRYETAIGLLERQGTIRREGGNVRILPEFLFTSNEILVSLLPD